MSTSLKTCDVCSSEFMVKFRWQIDANAGGVRYFCKETCRDTRLDSSGQSTCGTCGKVFSPKFAYQVLKQGDATQHFCSMECREPAVVQTRRRLSAGPQKIAVLNQKGGTGKTTTTVSLAAGLALQDYRVLVIDTDAQGHVGVSYGTEGEKTLYHILVENQPLESCVVQARPNLDVILANETLASAEIVLARMNDGRNKLLRERLHNLDAYDYVILDCGPSLSLMNMNALTFADHLIVPVACDYLSLVGVKQVMKTLKNVNSSLMHPIEILGILPTFYDMRNRISDEAVKTLKGYFNQKVLPPIRVNTQLKEAPQYQKTIFEHAPNSRGAVDYRRMVKWLISQSPNVAPPVRSATG